MNIIEAIKIRRSVRSFNGQPLSEDILIKLKKTIDESFSFFGGKLTIKLKSFDLAAGFKPSTYGFIKGATDFFLLGMGNDEASALTAGFQFEQVVLKATELGLGTCWIAGTFKNSDFNGEEKWPEGESLRMVSPVGIAEKQRFMEKVGRMAMGSNNRLPFNKIFFQDDFSSPVESSNMFYESLEMLRLAPSSTNSQPWRVLVKDKEVLFYYKPKSAISIVDLGIGICHFYETERFNDCKGDFFKDENSPMAPEDWRYVISYKRE